MLELRPNEHVETFAVSCSNEERYKYAGDVLKNTNARIVLGTIQYLEDTWTTDGTLEREGAARNIDYILKHFDHVFIQWLNPGWSDGPVAFFDRLGLTQQLLSSGVTLSIRDATRRIPPAVRAQEIKEFIYGWASFRNLVFSYATATEAAE
jgi:hypothetical protein